MKFKPGDKLIFIDDSAYGGKPKAYYNKIAIVVKHDHEVDYVNVWFPEIGDINEYFGDSNFNNWNKPDIGGGFRPDQFVKYSKLAMALK